MNHEIHEQLKQLALKRSTPFCYQCYKEAPTARCATCRSDDLMRLLPGVGREYGTDWIIKHILEKELESVDLEEAFEESVRECYPEETKVGWMTFDTVTLMKEQDPIGWRCALADFESQEADEENIISFDNGSTYYSAQALEDFVKKESA
jgi:hypothetical protein